MTRNEMGSYEGRQKGQQIHYLTTMYDNATDVTFVEPILPASNFSVNVSENVMANVIKNPSKTLKVAFDISLTGILLTIMLGMGSTIELKTLKEHLRRPVGIVIGMFSQFAVLPAVMFGIAHALNLSKLPALGLLVLSCCPGGPISNVYTYWVDGDVALSLSMTIISTAIAAGMLPFNLFIYSRSWTQGSIVIPYINIFYSFLMAFCPSAFGVFLRWKWPKVAAVVVKVGNVCGALSIVLTLTLMSLLYPFIYSVPWQIYVGGTLLSVSGFIFGYLIASVCRMTYPKRRTIALETGVQNYPLCMALLNLTYEKEEFAEMALIPLIYANAIFITATAFLVLYKLNGARTRWMGNQSTVNVTNVEVVAMKEDCDE